MLQGINKRLGFILDDQVRVTDPSRGGNLVVPSLPNPALIDGWGDDSFKVFADDAANEEDSEVVLDGGEFCVIDSRLLVEFFTLFVEIDSHGVESQLRFPFNQSRFPPKLVYNPVLSGLDPPFSAGLVFVGQDRPGPCQQDLRAASHASQTSHLHAGTMSFIICNHNKASKPLVELLAVYLHPDPVGYDFAPGRSSAKRFTPEDLEHLAAVKS